MAKATLFWRGTTDGDWTNSTNWDPSTDDIPVTNDTCIIPKGASVAIDTNLEQSAVDLERFIIEDGCGIAIGSAERPLQIGMSSGNTVFDLAGTGQIHIEVAGGSAGAAQINVTAAGTAGLFLASYAPSGTAEDMCDTLNIEAPLGSVYVGWNPPEKAEVSDIIKSGACTLYIGQDVVALDASPIEEIRNSAGIIYCKSGVDLITQRGGTHYQDRGGVSTATVYSGTFYFRGSDNLDAANIYTDGKVDFSLNPNTISSTAVELFGEAEWNDPNNVVAVASIFDFNGTDADKVTINFGADRRITTAATS